MKLSEEAQEKVVITHATAWALTALITALVFLLVQSPLVLFGLFIPVFWINNIRQMFHLEDYWQTFLWIIAFASAFGIASFGGIITANRWCLLGMFIPIIIICVANVMHEREKRSL